MGEEIPPLFIRKIVKYFAFLKIYVNSSKVLATVLNQKI